MSETVLLTIDPEGNATVAAYCLKTDSWYDFLAFKKDAKQALVEGHQRNVNRFLRAALMCLFSHLEAVVKEIENQEQIPNIANRKRLRLCDKIQNITHEASKRRTIPHLNFRLGKHLRDLVAHPGIEIDHASAPGGNINYTSVFEELDLPSLEALEIKISSWIDAVCTALGTTRLTDTEHLATELAQSIGEVNTIKEI